MNDEYYVLDDRDKKEMQVCRYTFDIFHPNGEEIIVTSRSYGKDSPFTKSEAKIYANKMKLKFNGKKFQNQRPVYYDHKAEV